MITVSLPYQTDDNLESYFKQYNSMVRFAYNRFHDGVKNETTVRKSIKSMNNIGDMNSWLQTCAVRHGKSIQTRFREKNVIFGGKRNLILYLKNKIDKDQFKLNRLMPMNIQGEKSKNGNRMFRLDIINNNQIIFKLNRKTHFKLKLPKLKPNYKKLLHQLENINNDGEGHTYQINLTPNKINISFEPMKIKSIDLIENRYMGIDMNPETIGISIIENNEVIEKTEYSIHHIINEIVNQSISSDDKKFKKLNNQLKHETFEISKAISNLAKHFKCSNVFIEDLKFKSNVKNKYNHIGNRKTKNLWKRHIFTQNLEKRLKLYNIKLKTVNPAYSSFIGNLQYNYTDAINASIEIGRRGFDCLIKRKKKKFYPTKLKVKHQWKETVTLSKASTWKELFSYIKNSKMKYRVSYDELKNSLLVFRQNGFRIIKFT